MKRNNRRRAPRGRSGGMRRGRASEGYGRKASTSITVGATITGSQGINFTPEQLTRKYFQDPRLIRINGYRIRINILDMAQPFLTYQTLCVVDTIGGPFCCMTQPKQITIMRSQQSVRIARDRSFWIEAYDETHPVLDLKFYAYQPTKIAIEVTTFFNIEQDEVTGLAVIEMKPRELTSEEDGYEVMSNASTITKINNMSINKPIKRLH